MDGVSAGISLIGRIAIGTDCEMGGRRAKGLNNKSDGTTRTNALVMKREVLVILVKVRIQ